MTRTNPHVFNPVFLICFFLVSTNARLRRCLNSQLLLIFQINEWKSRSSDLQIVISSHSTYFRLILFTCSSTDDLFTLYSLFDLSIFTLLAQLTSKVWFRSARTCCISDICDRFCGRHCCVGYWLHLFSSPSSGWQLTFWIVHIFLLETLQNCRRNGMLLYFT
jgi:hypothetical protein